MSPKAYSIRKDTFMLQIRGKKMRDL